MGLVLYELGTEDGLLYGQFGLRTRMALAHKGIDFSSRVLRLSQLETMDFSEHKKVPVLLNGDRVIEDSWQIAQHLEDAFPDTPSMFGGDVGRALTEVFNLWMDRTVIPAVAPLVMVDVAGTLSGADGAHLRAGIEAAFRRPLEELAQDRETRRTAVINTLGPARIPLKSRPFITGDKPQYVDYIFYSMFVWIDRMAQFDPTSDDAVLTDWRGRMKDATSAAFAAK